MVRKFVLLLVLPLVMLALGPVQAHAQDSILGQLYGSGVHAYFSGDFTKSHDYLTEAIDAGSRDPRAFFFRGLCFRELGRDEQAESDFLQASDLEMQDSNLTPIVSRSLLRIQGPVRQAIETHRKDAQLAMYRRLEKMEADRQTPPVVEAAQPNVLDEPSAKDTAEEFDSPKSKPIPEPDASTSEPEKPAGNIFEDEDDSGLFSDEEPEAAPVPEKPPGKNPFENDPGKPPVAPDVPDTAPSAPDPGTPAAPDSSDDGASDDDTSDDGSSDDGASEEKKDEPEEKTDDDDDASIFDL